jgi:type IV secretory pathway VirB2 component (pilin)
MEDATVRRVGIASAISAAILSVIWFVTFQAKDAIAPVPDWHDVEAYAAALSPWRTVYIYPSLLLALAYLALLVAVHVRTRGPTRVWSLLALAIGIVYASMASINYMVQAVAVRWSLAAGETAGIEMFLPDNPRSLFGALATSYVYMGISMAALALVFGHGRLERVIRWILLAQLVSAAGQSASSVFGAGDAVLIATGLVWVIGAPVAFVLMARWFALEARSGSTPEPRPVAGAAS